MKTGIGLGAGIICCCLLLPANLYARVYMSEEEALEAAFPGADSVDEKTVIITQEQEKNILELLGIRKVSRIYKYYEGTKDGKVTGYAKIDNCIGKTQPITFMVVVDPGISVRMVEILAYRETQGGEIRQAGFREQFNGKRVTDPIRLNQDIRNISGATLSCRALTDEVRRIVTFLSVLLGSRAPGTEQGKQQESYESALPLEPAAHAAGNPIRFTRAQLLMGTILEITLYAHSSAHADMAFSSAFSRVAGLEKLLSTYMENSEISRLNRLAGVGPVTLSLEVMQLLVRCTELTGMTGGAFDVTVGPLCRLWNEAALTDELPSGAEVREARERVGAGGVALDAEKQEATLPAGMSIDMGAIGKGYALDCARKALLESGVSAALLNFGGNILSMGTPPGGRSWTVYVRDPGDETDSLPAVEIAGWAVSTSADYERGIHIRGNRYSHIIDPRTGCPAKGMLSVTVAAPSATEADALSTTLYALGFDEGTSFAEEHSIAALIMAKGKDIYRTPAFRAIEKEAPEN